MYVYGACCITSIVAIFALILIKPFYCDIEIVVIVVFVVGIATSHNGHG